MGKYLNKKRKIYGICLSAMLLMLASAVNVANLPTLGTYETVGKVDGLEIVAKVQSPSLQETPLQIVCLFEYTEGDIFNSPPALPKS